MDIYSAEYNLRVEKVKKTIIETLEIGFDDSKFLEPDDRVACLFIRYDSHHAFRPFLYLFTEVEKEKLEQSDNPIALYTSCEARYSTDNLTLPVDLEIDECEELGEFFYQLYENAYNEDNPDDESKYLLLDKTLFDIYLDICQRLNRNGKLTQYLPTSNDFHVMVCGSRQYNEWEFVHQLLPKKEIEKIEGKYRRFIKKTDLTPEESCLIDLIKQCMKTFEHIQG